MKRYLPFVLSVMSVTVTAALPPYAESMRRIDAVMKDSGVHKALGSVAWIGSVTQKEGNVYEVTSKQGCTVEARLKCTATGVRYLGLWASPFILGTSR